MNKKEFLRCLEKELGGLKKAERLRYVSQYEELLSDLTDNGFSEEEALAQQGSVRELAAELIKNTDPDQKTAALRYRFPLTVLLIAFVVIDALLLRTFGLSGHLFNQSVIGFADGSTAIWIASKPSLPFRFGVGLLLAVTAGLAVYLLTGVLRSKRHKK